MYRYPAISIVKTVILSLIVGIPLHSFAKEGMYIPAKLAKQQASMNAMGLEIPISQIFNDDGTGLNNAVVLFGTGCTAEIISSKGLLLTNDHCGYGTVQGLSSATNDYFAHGYWAQSMKDEIPCGGLKVTFIRKMENVTNKILSNIPDTLNDSTRNSIISIRIASLAKGYKYATKMDVTIKPYFDGNQYWAIITQTYRDVRLVAFPPNGIGTFGGDTENWMWPRHTGDFSMFRVYAGPNNQPADYSPDNKPYETQNFFTINTSGYKEGDFAMVYGFPAYTYEHIASSQLSQVYHIIDPIRIAVRTNKLKVWNEQMNASRSVFLKYTSKRAGLANGWKKWQGEILGLKNNDAIAQKEAYENHFQAWADAHESEYPYASSLLSQIQANVVAADSFVKASEYTREAVYGIELIQQAASLNNMLNVIRAGITGQRLQDSLTTLAKRLAGFYKNYDVATDKKVFEALMPMFFDHCTKWIPSYYSDEYNRHDRDFNKWANALYNSSLLTEKDKLITFAKNVGPKDSARIMADPAWQLYYSITEERNNEIIPPLYVYYKHMDYLNRLYVKCQMAIDSNMYPDANFTLRLSYGKVKGIDPQGPAPYSYQTNLDEAIALDDSSSYEFRVPEKLKELYHKKDYGRWAVNGTVPLAFITDCHTSGGNSGSPVLNAKGQLIGTNFDRVWEGTMSDYDFDPRVCRNISLDIRYTLFILEKYGNAGWLLKEMKLVKN